MIDAYVVRDPQGTVIGISVVSANAALDDARIDDDIRLGLPYVELGVGFVEEGSANVNGYTLNKEKLSL
jgi:hypothetical protein